MNEGVQVLLDYMLSENIMLISFFGVTLLLTETGGARRAMRGGLIIATAALVSSLAGTLLATALPGGEVVEKLTFLVISLIAVSAIRAGGLLTGERYGIPAPLYALPLLVGSQAVLTRADLDFPLTFAAAVGLGIGVYIVYVLSASMLEQIRLTETNSVVKGVPALVIALGILGLALMGFQLL